MTQQYYIKCDECEGKGEVGSPYPECAGDIDECDNCEGEGYLPVSLWRSVEKDGLPPRDSEYSDLSVYVAVPDGIEWQRAFYNFRKVKWFIWGNIATEVTQYMPIELPESPDDK